MDYVDILKRAWRVTWRYKILWLFGLFAAGTGGGGSGGGGGRGYSSGARDGGRGAAEFDRYYRQAVDWVAANAALVIALVAVLVVIGIVWWVLSVAARGGLIVLVDDAERGERVTAGRGWSTGFHYWGRIFLVSLLLGLPILLLGGVLAIAVVVALVPLARAGDSVGSAAGGALAGMCGLFAVLVPVMLIVGFIVGILELLASRYAVLADMHALDAIRASWQAFRARFRDVLLMWLVMLVAGIAYGFLVAIIAVALFIPALLALFAEAYAVAAAMFVGGILLLLLPGAIYGAFTSAAWTIFFRRLTGRELPAVAAPYGAPAPGASMPPGYLPPPPPASAPMAPQASAPMPPQAPGPMTPPPPQTGADVPPPPPVSPGPAEGEPEPPAGAGQP